VGIIYKIKKIVMAFITKSKNNQSTDTNTSSELSEAEYEVLFKIIKTSTFKGEDIEILYRLILKLQSNYILLKNNKL
jgi:glutathione peroxidase-family protein